ncbi:MAG: TIGR04211 family SH3 domain-containing protein [Pseudomonadota bacterium]
MLKRIVVNCRLLLASCVGLLVLAALPAAAQETTYYVTDRLRLGLHNAEDTSDRPFRVLDSGQAMVVVARNGNYAQVRLPDGTEGYVKAAYLVDEKPAILVVSERAENYASMETELADAKAKFAGSAGRISELERQVGELNGALNERKDKLGTLTDENQKFRQQMSLYRFSLPWPIVLGAALVAVVLGFIGGMWWIDHRSRKRHGGFRIY